MMSYYQIFIRSISLYSILVLFCVSGLATAFTLSVTDDSFTSSKSPGTKHADAGDLQIEGRGPGQPVRSTYARFDTSLLHEGITDSDVLKASLRIYVSRVKFAGMVHVYRVQGHWDEKTLSHDSAPSNDLLPLTSIMVNSTDVGQFRYLDVTAAVRDWVANPGANYGLVLMAEDVIVYIASKEDVLTGHAVEIQLNLASLGPVGPPGEKGSQGEQGIPGPEGARGPAGLSCWDNNGNGVQDVIEDSNNDGLFNVLDCVGNLNLSSISQRLSDIENRLQNADLDNDGFTPTTGDCDDSDFFSNPDQPEIPGDSLDNDCDGIVDNPLVDLDGDGFSVAGGDCDDNNPLISPVAVEVTDGIDNNCNGLVDENLSQLASDMLFHHNLIRRTVKFHSQDPNPLPQVQWNDSLATTAQTWANGCVFAHNTERGPLGENIAAGGPSSVELFNLWAAEDVYYNYATNSCASNKICGHYTQLVWRDTTEIGCGIATCGFGIYLVCNYSPPGNFAGQLPY